MAEKDVPTPEEILEAQAKQLDIKVDKRWSLDTLAEKVQEAQAAKSAEKSAAIKAKADTWVLLLRDAFPVEDEKHLAGETIHVPKSMAEYWYDNGVARPGKAPADD